MSDKKKTEHNQISDARNPKATHTPETAASSPMGHVLDMIRNAGHGFMFTVGRVYGETTTEHRIAKRLHKVRWALEHREVYFTPAQLQALAMVYGCEMPPYECARRLGIERQSFRERLVRGEERVDRLWTGDHKRLNVKKGRPTAHLDAPDGAAWMELKARERLGGIGATHIWGIDSEQRPGRISDAEFEQILAEERAKDK